MKVPHYLLPLLIVVSASQASRCHRTGGKCTDGSGPSDDCHEAYHDDYQTKHDKELTDVLLSGLPLVRRERVTFNQDYSMMRRDTFQSFRVLPSTVQTVLDSLAGLSRREKATLMRVMDGREAGTVEVAKSGCEDLWEEFASQVDTDRRSNVMRYYGDVMVETANKDDTMQRKPKPCPAPPPKPAPLFRSTFRGVISSLQDTSGVATFTLNGRVENARFSREQSSVSRCLVLQSRPLTETLDVGMTVELTLVRSHVEADKTVRYRALVNATAPTSAKSPSKVRTIHDLRDLTFRGTIVELKKRSGVATILLNGRRQRTRFTDARADGVQTSQLAPLYDVLNVGANVWLSGVLPHAEHDASVTFKAFADVDGRTECGSTETTLPKRRRRRAKVYLQSDVIEGTVKRVYPLGQSGVAVFKSGPTRVQFRLDKLFIDGEQWTTDLAPGVLCVGMPITLTNLRQRNHKLWSYRADATADVNAKDFVVVATQRAKERDGHKSGDRTANKIKGDVKPSVAVKGTATKDELKRGEITGEILKVKIVTGDGKTSTIPTVVGIRDDADEAWVSVYVGDRNTTINGVHVEEYSYLVPGDYFAVGDRVKLSNIEFIDGKTCLNKDQVLCEYKATIKVVDSEVCFMDMLMSHKEREMMAPNNVADSEKFSTKSLNERIVQKREHEPTIFAFGNLVLRLKSYKRNCKIDNDKEIIDKCEREVKKRERADVWEGAWETVACKRQHKWKLNPGGGVRNWENGREQRARWDRRIAWDHEDWREWKSGRKCEMGDFRDAWVVKGKHKCKDNTDQNKQRDIRLGQRLKSRNYGKYGTNIWMPTAIELSRMSYVGYIIHLTEKSGVATFTMDRYEEKSRFFRKVASVEGVQVPQRTPLNKTLSVGDEVRLSRLKKHREYDVTVRFLARVDVTRQAEISEPRQNGIYAKPKLNRRNEISSVLSGREVTAATKDVRYPELHKPRPDVKETRLHKVEKDDLSLKVVGKGDITEGVVLNMCRILTTAFGVATFISNGHEEKASFCVKEFHINGKEWSPAFVQQVLDRGMKIKLTNFKKIEQKYYTYTADAVVDLKLDDIPAKLPNGYMMKYFKMEHETTDLIGTIVATTEMKFYIKTIQVPREVSVFDNVTKSTESLYISQKRTTINGIRMKLYSYLIPANYFYVGKTVNLSNVEVAHDVLGRRNAEVTVVDRDMCLINLLKLHNEAKSRGEMPRAVDESIVSKAALKTGASRGISTNGAVGDSNISDKQSKAVLKTGNNRGISTNGAVGDSNTSDKQSKAVLKKMGDSCLISTNIAVGDSNISEKKERIKKIDVQGSRCIHENQVNSETGGSERETANNAKMKLKPKPKLESEIGLDGKTITRNNASARITKALSNGKDCFESSEPMSTLLPVKADDVVIDGKTSLPAYAVRRRPITCEQGSQTYITGRIITSKCYAETE